MKQHRDRQPCLFVDDGHPEARDYDSNYVVLDPQQRRRLLGPAAPPTPPRSRDAAPPRTERIAAGS